jgi:hypothetical protein
MFKKAVYKKQPKLSVYIHDKISHEIFLSFAKKNENPKKNKIYAKDQVFLKKFEIFFEFNIFSTISLLKKGDDRKKYQIFVTENSLELTLNHGGGDFKNSVININDIVIKYALQSMYTNLTNYEILDKESFKRKFILS